MSDAARGVMRHLVIGLGAAVVGASLLAMRLDDAPRYAIFFGMAMALMLPAVEVLPGMAVRIPQMAVTIGFLYLIGPPVIVLALAAQVVARVVGGVLPVSWVQRFPQLRPEADRGPVTAYDAAESMMFAIMLGTRWGIASAFAATGPPILDPGLVALGEIAGYLAWGGLATLPIYREGPLVAWERWSRRRTALKDTSLVMILVLEPFVFLIVSGYAGHGLDSAIPWALSSLGPHVILRRLNDRRLRVEAQHRELEMLGHELEHRERLSAIGKMSSIVSHQILQQLGVIGLYADLIQRAEAGDDPREALARVRANAENIEGALDDVNRVLTDLLVFSRDLRLNRYPHPVVGILDDVAEAVGAMAEARRVRVAVACPPDLDAEVDKLKLRQALENVVRNAIEASPAGAVVELVGRLDDAWVEIVVTDRGPGIPLAERDRIFEPFHTTKEHGTGLGLAIAREFVQAHGGTIDVTDAGGSGTRFVIRVPSLAP